MRRSIALCATLSLALAVQAQAVVYIEFKPITVTDPNAQPLKPGETPFTKPGLTGGNRLIFFNDSIKRMRDFHVRMSSGTDKIIIAGSPFFDTQTCNGTQTMPAITQCDTVELPGIGLNGIAPGASFALIFYNYDSKEHIFNVRPSYAAVPEPGTWSMMVLGFGLVGALRRRRVHAAA